MWKKTQSNNDSATESVSVCLRTDFWRIELRDDALEPEDIY